MANSPFPGNPAAPDTVFSFVHDKSGKALDGNGAEVYLANANGGDFQRWQLRPGSSAGYVRIRHCWSDKMLAHHNGSLCFRAQEEHDSQLWQLEQLDYGRQWVMRNKASGRVLDSNTKTVYMEPANGGSFQEWRPQVDTANWLAGLAGHLTLHDLCLPGSHDAAMYELDQKLTLSDQAWYAYVGGIVDSLNVIGNLWDWITGDKKTGLGGVVVAIAKRLGLTQSLNLYDQLRAGSRFFDLRPGYRDDTQDFHILHGNAVGPRLRPVLTDIARFLREHPSELAVLEFSHFNNMNDKKQEQLLHLITSCFSAAQLLQLPAATALSTVPLDQLRGKAVLLLDDDNRFAQALQAPGVQGVYRLKESLPIFDDYANVRSYDAMRADQATKFRAFGQQPDRLTPTKPTLFLLNWTLTPLNKDAEAFISKDAEAAIGPSVEEYAAQVNPQLATAVYENTDGLFGKQAQGHRVNVLNLDFVQTANPVPLCLEIIRRTNEAV